LGPAEGHKGDINSFWNPITKHVVESCSVVFLQQTYDYFQNLVRSQIAKQVAIITDELNEMFDNYEDVTPVDDEGKNLPNKTANLDNDDNNEDEEFVMIIEDMIDPTNPELTYNEDDNEIIPELVQRKSAGIPRSIRSLATFTIPIHKMNGKA
jgi:hypothetical protein